MNDNPEHREALLTAKGEIEAVLRKHDVIAQVVLLRPHAQEVLTVLDASWCRLTIEDKGGKPALRMRSLTKDHPDPDKRHADIEASVGAAMALGEILAINGMHWLDWATQLTKVTGGQHTPMRQVRKQ